MRKVVRKQIRRSQPGLDVAADINAVLSTNVGGAGEKSVTSSQQSVQVHQRSSSSTGAPDTGETSTKGRQ
ncbi:MAG: hypothetical protein ABR520_09365 [Mycobacteriales bacterium]|nr:hypothetical protein [Frankia sp.]